MLKKISIVANAMAISLLIINISAASCPGDKLWYVPVTGDHEGPTNLPQIMQNAVDECVEHYDSAWEGYIDQCIGYCYNGSNGSCTMDDVRIDDSKSDPCDDPASYSIQFSPLYYEAWSLGTSAVRCICDPL